MELFLDVLKVFCKILNWLFNLCLIVSQIIYFYRLGQSCNHVAAILLKVDYCWRMGYVSKSCTSKESTWNVPSGAATVVEPLRMKDLSYQKPSASAPSKLIVYMSLLIVIQNCLCLSKFYTYRHFSFSSWFFLAFNMRI